MNHDLERTLPLASQLEDVFAAIRPSYDRPELWEDTKEIRSELDGLHKALSFVNCTVAKNGLQAIPFAVKVEEDFEELRSRAEDSGIISSLPLAFHSLLVGLWSMSWKMKLPIVNLFTKVLIPWYNLPATSFP
nr:hypothetical protein FVER53263_20938 [Fusarium verticillioides]